MRPYDIILKKRNGHPLEKEELAFLIEGFVHGNIPDYQVAAWAMAVYFNGMTPQETADLTQIMVDSGETLDLSTLPGCKVDKHSTGGVADTASLVLVPLVAAAGIPVVKLSGRGLGHTGGTIDKLESIPGFKTQLSKKELFEVVKKCGAVIAAQSGNLVPADKKLYALRDVTATVDSIPLIAGSIMSKKIASGADRIVLDVKVGLGAFMKTQEEAQALGEMMVAIGNKMNRKTVALLTAMDQPLGNAIGNALEVKEAIDTLRGEVQGDLYQLSLSLASEMLLLAGRCSTEAEAMSLLERLIQQGKALETWAAMIEAQGGDPRVIEEDHLLPKAKHIIPFHATEKGYVHTLHAELVGRAAMTLGAGRTYQDQPIYQEVGIMLKKRCGDYVDKGEVVAMIHMREEAHFEEAKALLSQAFVLQPSKPEPTALLLGKIT